MSRDAGDPRVFPPPDVPVECFCLHCGRVYTSDLMIPIEIDGETHYCCPAEGCTAMGWEFDIFPVNEEDSVNGEWFDDEDDDSDTDNDQDPGFEPITELDAETDAESMDEILAPTDSFEPPREWTPDADRDDDDDDAVEDNESQRFTQEDFDRLKQSGEIDRRIAEIRERWIASAQERETTANPLDDRDDKPFKDEDIPF